LTDKLKSRQQLLNEIRDISTRLEVAEETIQAIHHGRVDALIVAQFEKTRTILLEGAEIPYHAIVDSMGEGVVILIPDGTIFFCNPRFLEIVQIPLEKLIGTAFKDLFLSEDQGRLAAIYKNSGLGIARGEFSIQSPQGKFVSVQLSAHQLEAEDEEGITIVVTDLSDLKLAEKGKWEAEHKLNKTLQSMVDGTLVVDLTGKITFANPAAERILEIPNEKLIGIYYYSNELNLVDANRNPYPHDQLSLTIALRDQCEVKAVDHGILTTSGKIKWLSINTSPLLDEKGQLYGAIASFRDVSEQKKDEEELRQMHEWNALQASLLDQVRNAVIATDLDGKIFYWNKFAETLYQWKAEEVIGKPIQEVTVPEAEAGLSERIMDSIQQLGYWEGEFIVNRKDGSLFPAQVLDTLIKNTEGMVIGVLGVSIDITERKRAEEDIWTSEKRYRSLFENMNEGFAYCKMLYENKLPVDFTYLDVNSSFEQITGLKNVVEKNVSEVLPGIQSSNPNLFEIFGNVALTGNPERFDTFIDQLGIWLSISVYSPESGYFIAVFDNITERKQAEEEIQSHSQELKMLYELSRALAGAKNLNQVLDIVNRHTVETVHVTFSRIGLLEGGNLVMRGAYPIRVLDHDLFVGDKFFLSTLPNCRHALKGNKPVVLQRSNPKVGDEERSALLLDHIQSICLMPLRVGKTGANSGHLLGMLMVGEARDDGREPISPRKLSLIRGIGDQAASAIRRMLLSQETDRRLQHLSALSEIDRVITSSVDLNTSLMTILTQVIKQLDVDAASVMLLNSSNLTLEYFCGQGFQNKAIERSRLRLGESHAGKAALERVIVHIPNLQRSNHVRVTPNLIEENFVEYYGVPLIAKGQVKGVLEIFNRKPFRLEDELFGFLKSLAEQAAIAIDNTMMFNHLTRSNIELKLAYNETIEGWSHALDLRDKETEGHTLRVTEKTLELARSFGLGEDELVNIRWGGLLHDIGKMGIPDGILLKPGPLTDEEWVLMKKHPSMAYEMLSPIHYLRHALDIPYCHHEKWDGSGYPRGLKDEQIPLTARIFAVVDVWDALRSDRPYRPAWTVEKTIEYIQSESGTHFDPQVVKAFILNLGINGTT
jgi:PAS domain S-box-containing protein/putative nucleotidyltransferase with HDIG domain